MRIDVHAHYNPAIYFAELEAAGAFEELSIMRILGSLWRPAPGAPKPSADIDAAALSHRLADMDAAGVERQIVSVGAAHPYLSDPAAAAHCCAVLNDGLRDLCAAAPQRLWAFASLPLPHVAESLAEIARVAQSGAFVGFALGASAQGVPIDDARFAPVWEELNRRQAIVYLHPGAEIGGVPGCTEFHLAPDFVSPAETAVCAARLLLTGALERYPDIEFVLAALAGSLPVLANRFDHGVAQDNPALHERLGGVKPHLRRFWADTSTTEEPLLLRAAKELLGTEHLLLGSDFSRPGVRAQDAVDFVAQSPDFTPAEREAVIDENATRLFARFLPAS